MCARCARPLVGGVCPACLAQDDGPYELITRLGRGGMGEVWRARHRVLGREVALKFLAEELVDRPGFAGRFAKEARLLARVRHPGVVEIFEVGELDGCPYFAMELLDGEPLHTLAPLPPDRAITITRQVAEALAACHAVGVIHRDVKPENVVVAGERVVLIDFGIAWSAQEGPGTLTRAGMVMGTPAFLAPEVAAGQPPDPKADVYALGGLLYQLLTGQPPSGVLQPTPHADLIRAATAPWAARIPTMDQLVTQLRLREHQGVDGALPPEELTLQRAAAGVLTVASALGFGALLDCVTPRVVTEAQPLVMETLQRLPDGRYVSHARFEEGPILGAVAGMAVGAVVWALIVGHWRRSGLLTRGGRVPQVRLLMAILGAALTWAAMRWSLDIRSTGVGPFLPVIGGVLETGCLAAFWMGQLERARRGYTVWQAWPLLAGMGAALVPPVVTLWDYLSTWAP